MADGDDQDLDTGFDDAIDDPVVSGAQGAQPLQGEQQRLAAFGIRAKRLEGRQEAPADGWIQPLDARAALVA